MLGYHDRYPPKAMIRALLIFTFTVLAGCESRSGPASVASQKLEIETRSITEPPSELLESVAKLYNTESQGWPQFVGTLDPAAHPVFSYALDDLISRGDLPERHEKIARNALLRNTPRPIDRSIVLELLEISGYADVMCETGEYEIRVSTLEYLESHLESPLVRDALNRIVRKYECKLPDDEHGLLSTAMEIRVPEYATQLLKQPERNDGG